MWGALGVGEQNLKMAAVTVAINGVSRPIVVPWRNKGVFDTMIDAIVRSSRGRMQGLVGGGCKMQASWRIGGASRLLIHLDDIYLRELGLRNFDCTLKERGMAEMIFWCPTAQQ